MNDCKHLVSKYSLEDKPIGITALGERQDKVMIIPPLSRLEINQMLHWSVPEFVTWPEDSYYFDFVAINLPNQVRSSGNDKLVYVVALKKSILMNWQPVFKEWWKPKNYRLCTGTDST